MVIFRIYGDSNGGLSNKNRNFTNKNNVGIPWEFHAVILFAILMI